MLEAIDQSLVHARRAANVRWERELPGWRGTALFYGPTPVEDDRGIARQVVDAVDSAAVTVVTSDLAPRQLAGLYGRAELVAGVRLHAVILAMAGGAPVFAIDYFTDKTQGILEMARLGDGWCRYDDFRAEQLLAGR